jgi:hypothetical protein
MSINFPNVEQDVLAFWKDTDAFQTQLRLTEGGKQYNFYDGPPFATGKLDSIFRQITDAHSRPRSPSLRPSPRFHD